MTDRSDEAQTSSIYSANKWETSSLGDDKQREKFLRLMGGMKKQSTGRFVIGGSQEGHARSEEENKTMIDKIENQYQTGLTAKLSGQNRQHFGLGFTKPEEPKEKQSPEGTHTRFSDGDDADKEEEREKLKGHHQADGEREEYRGRRREDSRRGDEDRQKSSEREDEKRKHSREEQDGKDQKRREDHGKSRERRESREDYGKNRDRREDTGDKDRKHQHKDTDETRKRKHQKHHHGSD